jgi:hypothetical protein
MTSKDLKDAKDALPIMRTPNYLPLLAVAHELAQLGDALGCAENTEPHPLMRDHEVIDEIAAQLGRVREKFSAKAVEAPLPVAVPVPTDPAALPVVVPGPVNYAPPKKGKV